MNHYGITQWVDFARGVAAESDRVLMQQHLDRGCSECRELAGFCQGLNETCQTMATSVVPEWLVHRALAIFPRPVPESPKRGFRIPVELIYDSFLLPAPAGLRSTWQVGWQGLYRAGDCSLDLRIEPELHSSRAAVIGQISNHSLPENHISDVPICLKSGKLIVAQTRSNQFGEFQMEYEQQGRLRLCVYLDGGARSLQVPLKRLASDRPVGTERLGLGSATGRKRLDADRH